MSRSTLSVGVRPAPRSESRRGAERRVTAFFEGLAGFMSSTAQDAGVVALPRLPERRRTVVHDGLWHHRISARRLPDGTIWYRQGAGQHGDRAVREVAPAVAAVVGEQWASA